jgi:hypothetical protein
MKRLLKMMLATATVAIVAACGGSDDPAPAPGNLAQVADAAGFTSLVAAADKAGLVPALTDPSASLTVFAPTNAAFDALATSLGLADGAAMVAALDGATLAKILSYHVLPTRKDAAAIIAGGATQATLATSWRDAGDPGCRHGERRHADRRGSQRCQRDPDRCGGEQRGDPRHRQGARPARRADRGADGAEQLRLLGPRAGWSPQSGRRPVTPGPFTVFAPTTMHSLRRWANSARRRTNCSPARISPAS